MVTRQGKNKTIAFTVENQPFTPYTDSIGNYIGLYYNFEVKGHFTDTWTQYPLCTNWAKHMAKYMEIF